MVLGPILEHHSMVNAIKSSWDFTRFVDRPTALAFMALTVIIIVVGLHVRLRRATPERHDTSR